MNWGAGDTGRLAGVGEIAEIVGVTRARADQLSRQQGFPQPYGIIAAKSPRPQRIWLTRDVRKWVEENRPEKVTW